MFVCECERCKRPYVWCDCKKLDERALLLELERAARETLKAASQGAWDAQWEQVKHRLAALDAFRSKGK